MSRIRILSLDGGGTRASVLARALGALYGGSTRGRDIIRKFDFVAGNSGGSIVLTALCCGYTPNEIAAFYSDPATLSRLFSPRWTARVPLLRFVFGSYSTTGKLGALREILDRRRQPGGPRPSEIFLRDWPAALEHPGLQLIVCAFDFDQERATFFRSNSSSRAKSSTPAVEVALVDAVHASTTPPLPYYDEPAQVAGRRYWDGALAGYNNPVFAAVVEALANRPRDADLDDIRVLSIGTGGILRPLAKDAPGSDLGKPRENTGALTSYRKAGTAIFADPPDVASFHAHMALRQPLPEPGAAPPQGNVVRLSPLVRPIWDGQKSEWTLPEGLSREDFEQLVRMRLDPMEPAELSLIARMCDLWIAGAIPNQPIRMGDHMRSDIGHDTYRSAADHWHAIAHDAGV